VPKSAPEPEPARERVAKAAPPPRRKRAPGPAPAHPRRRPAQPPRLDQLCAAAEGAVPPSIVDLCLRQYGR
ncbi:MarR family transcriptional regulator, partial [Streptomyces sp. NPDC056544]